MSPRPKALGVTGEPHGGIRTLLETSDGRPKTIREVMILLERELPTDITCYSGVDKADVIDWVISQDNPHPTLLAQLLICDWMSEDQYNKYYPWRATDINDAAEA